MNKLGSPPAMALGLALVTTGCSQGGQQQQRQPIKVDGSSTVFPITEAIANAYAEMAACDEASIRFYELPVAFDALTIVVNQENDWAEDIIVEELKTLWEPTAQG